LGYAKQYPNKVDFSNATLLAEFGVVFKRGLPLNIAYAYLPDKISFTDGTGRFNISEDLSFSPFGAVGGIESKTMQYDKNGFLSSITSNNKTEFFTITSDILRWILQSPFEAGFMKWVL
jgi:hypothetical protein